MTDKPLTFSWNDVIKPLDPADDKQALGYVDQRSGPRYLGTDFTPHTT